MKKEFIKGFVKQAGWKWKATKALAPIAVPVGAAAYGVKKLTEDPDKQYYDRIDQARKAQAHARPQA